MTSWLVHPSSPSGNGRRIELAGLDLWILARIDSVFVYPFELDIDRFNDALSRTLSLWPLVCGRFLLCKNGQYVIEMSDNAIPVNYTENNEMKKWPNELNVVLQLSNNPLTGFIDEVQTMKLIHGSQEEPLVCFKLTRIVQSGEWVLGVSWEHVLGDAEPCLRFLNTISRVYQQLIPLEPLPVFGRRLWRQDEYDLSLVSVTKQLRDALPLKDMLKNFMGIQTKYDQVNLHFSGKHLFKLRELAGEKNITLQDSLTAYIIVTLNTCCYQNDDQRLILRTNTTVNFRGVSDLIASVGQVSNAVFMMLSDNFDDPYSLSSIAKTIRCSIIKSRDPKFLESSLATADALMKSIVRDDLTPNLGYFANEVTVNSNLRYDWADLVDFGYKNKCRFYTAWTGPLYFRVFRLNLVEDGHGSFARDQHGAEVAFLIEKDKKDTFLSAWHKDIAENFVNVKQ
ncbi:unnamed protein product [Rotaria magnacalcarata]|uniref:Uncharacterized protein n=1 Tax=Rotaria magnacalcarata TaxID=392030 RepID=A0A819F783_9BILA|nr:unnamed protein product [Rotaria magnacalcarata]CAF3863821.1 unnamed protein product [Rotaria magnacalcarata]